VVGKKGAYPHLQRFTHRLFSNLTSVFPFYLKSLPPPILDKQLKLYALSNCLECHPDTPMKVKFHYRLQETTQDFREYYRIIQRDTIYIKSLNQEDSELQRGVVTGDYSELQRVIQNYIEGYIIIHSP